MCAIFFIGFLFFSVWFFAFRKFSGCRGLRAYVFKLLILKAQHRIKKTLLPIFCQQKRHFSCYIQSNQCRLTLLNARLNNLAWCFPSILQVIQDIQIDWSSPSIPYQSQLHFYMYAWPHHRCCRKRFFPPSERFERFVENQWCGDLALLISARLLADSSCSWLSTFQPAKNPRAEALIIRACSHATILWCWAESRRGEAEKRRR